MVCSLSLCMIVKDEGDYLEDCLNSIKGMVDEIVIVDTGSKDNTIEIAKRFTNKVYEHEWPEDFSKARNIALGYATKDWVLFLDADEVISEDDLKRVKELILDDKVDGYVLIQRNYTNDSSKVKWIPCFRESKYTKDFRGYEPSRLVRLFRNHKGFEYRNKVHELVEYSINEKGGRIEESTIFIHHYRDYKPSEFEDEKRKTYFKLGEEQIKERPRDERAYYETGLICISQGNYKEAIEKFKRVIELNPDYKRAYYNIGNAYYHLKGFKEAEKALKKSIEKRPGLVASYNLLGIIYQEEGKYKEAIDILAAGLKIKENDLLLQSLGGIWIKLGKFERAIKILNIALQINPTNLGVLNNLGGAYFGMGKYEDSVKVLNRVVEINDKDFDAYRNLAISYFKNRQEGEAIKVLDKAINIFPENKEELNKIKGAINAN